MKNYLNILILIGAFAGFLAVQLTFDLVDLSAETSSVQSLEYGYVNNAFKETTFTALDGKVIDPKNTGVTILFFWASWCAPCLHELPWYSRIRKDYSSDQLVIVGVNVDENDQQDKVRRLVRDYGMNYPVIIDNDGELSSRFLVESLPTIMIFKRDELVDIYTDASSVSEATLRTKISNLID